MPVGATADDVTGLAAKLEGLDLTPGEQEVLAALLDRACGAEVSGFVAPAPLRDRLADVMGLGAGLAPSRPRPPSFDEADALFGKRSARDSRH